MKTKFEIMRANREQQKSRAKEDEFERMRREAMALMQLEQLRRKEFESSRGHKLVDPFFKFGDMQ